MQHDAADQLHVEVAHVQRAATGFADDRERFGKQILERRAVRQPLPELLGLGAELLVGQALDVRFVRVDLGNERPDAFQLAIVRGADDFGEESIDNHAEGTSCTSPTGDSDALPGPERSGYQPIVRNRPRRSGQMKAALVRGRLKGRQHCPAKAGR